MIRRVFSVLCITICLLAAGPVLAGDICTEPVETGSGLVRGLSETATATCVWQGIPYAEPPVGELRWKAPEPTSWSGVMNADEWGARCMQKGAMELVNADPSEQMSEDCLFLNIWRPAKPGKFPVMIWIHGGAYDGGTGNTPMYWGDRMSETGDIVLVSINYRLNIFGFTALPGLKDEDPNASTGNYGSLDQIAAIRWVHENIEGFGGDPENVTIFGESAGGWSVCTMIATPLNKGMFQRAIIESGGCTQSEGLQEGYRRAEKMADNVGCSAQDLQCLRSVSAEDLLGRGTGGLGMATKTHHDGYVLSSRPLDMIREGNYNRVSLMAGSNRDEVGPLMIIKPKMHHALPWQYQKRMVTFFGISEDQAAYLAELYPLSEFNKKPKKAYSQMGTDSALGCPTYNGLASVAAQQDGTYLYRFDYDGFRLGKVLHTIHAMEIPFVFNSLDRPPIGMLYGKGNIDEAQELSLIIQDYWLNFAKTGDPNGPGLPDWPVFGLDNQELQVLDTYVRTEDAKVQKRCEFWDEYAEDHSLFYEDL